MGLVTTFYRVWERGSRWLRSGGSLRGVLGTWGLQLSIQTRSVCLQLIPPPMLPNQWANCTLIQETGQTAAQGPSPYRRQGDEAGAGGGSAGGGTWGAAAGLAVGGRRGGTLGSSGTGFQRQLWEPRRPSHHSHPFSDLPYRFRPPHQHLHCRPGVRGTCDPPLPPPEPS